MRVRSHIGSFSYGVLPLLLAGLCAFFMVPHRKAVHARMPASRSIRTATRSSESCLVVDHHEGEHAQSAALLGPSFQHRDHPRVAGKTPVAPIASLGISWTLSAPSLLPRGGLDVEPDHHIIPVRSPRGPPSLI